MPLVPPQATRLHEISQEALTAERSQVEQDLPTQQRILQEDLARQTGILSQQDAWRNEEFTRDKAWWESESQQAINRILTQQGWSQADVSREVGRIGEDAPEQLGRIGSEFAAMGSYGSGAREEAQGDYTQQIERRIFDLQTQLARQIESQGWQMTDLQEDLARQLSVAKASLDQQTQMGTWERELMGTRAQREQERLQLEAHRSLEGLARQVEAQELQWQLNLMSGAGGFSSGGSRRTGGGGGATAGQVNEIRAKEFRNAHIAMYHAEGDSMAIATSKAIADTRITFPGISEETLYSGRETVEEFAETSFQVYQGAYADANSFLANSPGATPQQFLTWYTNRLKSSQRSQLQYFQATVLQAFADAKEARFQTVARRAARYEY